MATISSDPRFKLARALLSGNNNNNNDDVDAGGNGSGSNSGSPPEQFEAAIEIFATLLEESRVASGESSLNAALCQYEYGNALFRAAVRRNDDDDDDSGSGEEDKKPAAMAESKSKSQREIVAAAALKRSSAAAGAIEDDSNAATSAKRIKTGEGSSDEKKAGLKVKGGDGDAHDVLSITADKTGAEVMKEDVNNGDVNDNDEEGDDDDVALALDMMRSSFQILMTHTAEAEDDDQDEQKQKHMSGEESTQQQKQKEQQWAVDQFPRILVCIGDLYSFRREYGNAVDAYCRALPYREEAWEQLQSKAKESTSDSSVVEKEKNDSHLLLTVESLQCQRRLVETNALIVEALLACTKGEDIVCHHDDDDEEHADAETSQSKSSVLVPAKERINYARSYYENARTGMADILYRMAKMSAAKMEFGNEKKDVSVLGMVVVGVGMALTEEEDQAS